VYSVYFGVSDIVVVLGFFVDVVDDCFGELVFFGDV